MRFSGTRWWLLLSLVSPMLNKQMRCLQQEHHRHRYRHRPASTHVDTRSFFCPNQSRHFGVSKNSPNFPIWGTYSKKGEGTSGDREESCAVVSGAHPTTTTWILFLGLPVPANYWLHNMAAFWSFKVDSSHKTSIWKNDHESNEAPINQPIASLMLWSLHFPWSSEPDRWKCARSEVSLFQHSPQMQITNC